MNGNPKETILKFRTDWIIPFPIKLIKRGIILPTLFPSIQSDNLYLLIELVLCTFILLNSDIFKSFTPK